MARIIITAVSKRPDGYCIAGIDYDTGEVVRPVPATGDGIPPFRCIVDGKFLALRQIVEMDLGRAPRDPPQFQRENRPIRSWKWSILSRAKLSTLEQYVDNSAPVLHTTTDRVAKSYLDGLQPQHWKSLQLIKPSRLTFGHHYFDANRWVAEFNDSAGNLYSLKITDPEVTRLLTAGKVPEQGALLTVSLPKPWAPPPTPGEPPKAPACYKVVAAVIT